MPKNAFKMAFELQTRNQYTKVNCEIGMTVDGRELPSMAILGDAMEEAIKLIQDKITESYKTVPARAPTNVPTSAVPDSKPAQEQVPPVANRFAQ